MRNDFFHFSESPRIYVNKAPTLFHLELDSLAILWPVTTRFLSSSSNRGTFASYYESTRTSRVPTCDGVFVFFGRGFRGRRRRGFASRTLRRLRNFGNWLHDIDAFVFRLQIVKPIITGTTAVCNVCLCLCLGLYL